MNRYCRFCYMISAHINSIFENKDKQLPSNSMPNAESSTLNPVTVQYRFWVSLQLLSSEAGRFCLSSLETNKAFCNMPGSSLKKTTTFLLFWPCDLQTVITCYNYFHLFSIMSQLSTNHVVDTSLDPATSTRLNFHTRPGV